MDMPDNLKFKMQKFTISIRYDDTDDQSIKMYRSFIVENIYGVIKNTFPYFNSYADEQLKNKLIEHFLKKNHSFDPAFHQIATELLKCSKNIQMSEQLSKLIEFEWLIFSIEISNSEIYENNKVPNNIDFFDIKSIDINPTLEFIALPFNPGDLVNNMNIKEESIYIVYRNLDHRTYYQEIQPIEFAMISSLLEKGIETFNLTDFKELEGSYKKYLIEKLISWHNSNIVTLSLSAK